MFRLAFVTALLFAAAFVPHAAAASCPPPSDPVVASVGPFHLTAAPGVWQESNNVAGLQTTAGSCTSDDGRDMSWAADTQIA